MESLTLIVILIVMGVMMFFTSSASRKRTREADQFRKSIIKGDQVMTGSGLIGTIEAVDHDTKSVIINSEGTKTRWVVDAISKLPKDIAKLKDSDAKTSTKTTAKAVEKKSSSTASSKPRKK